MLLLLLWFKDYFETIELDWRKGLSFCLGDKWFYDISFIF